MLDKFDDVLASIQDRFEDLKRKVLTPHKIVGIRTWHINLNPSTMASMAFSAPKDQSSFTTSLVPSNHVDWRGPFAAQAGALIVEITTDKGLKGYGLGGGGLAASLIIDRHIRYFVLGKDPLEVESIWDNLYHITSIYGRRGLVIYALSGIDLALWDLCGKILDMPVYRLITDQPRLVIPAYATGTDAKSYVDQGFIACKIPLRNGPSQGDAGFSENLNIVHFARQSIPERVELMVDVYLRWDVDYTLRFANVTSDLGLKWIEEPIALDDYEGMAKLVQQVEDTWIVSGEHEFTRYGFRELLRWQAADMIQPDISWAGGFGECLRIAFEAAEMGIPTWPHQGGTPWGLHLIACLPMFCMAETFGLSRQKVENELFRLLRPTPDNGYFSLEDTPGFGLEINDKLLDAYTADRL